MPDDLLTIKQAAERRGCTPRAIEAAIRDGRLETYTSPAGELGVWRDDVDKLPAPRHPGRSKGEPVLSVAEVPGDDEALRAAFDPDERRLLSFSLWFTSMRGRLHIRDKPIVERLIRRFYRTLTDHPSKEKS